MSTQNDKNVGDVHALQQIANEENYSSYKVQTSSGGWNLRIYGAMMIHLDIVHELVLIFVVFITALIVGLATPILKSQRLVRLSCPFFFCFLGFVKPRDNYPGSLNRCRRCMHCKTESTIARKR